MIHFQNQFNYSNSRDKFTSSGTFILAEDNKNWLALTEPKGGVALLGKVVKADSKALRLEYIVVDTTQNNAVISTPAIIAKFGEKAEIATNSKSEKVTISLLATPTEYTHKE